MIEGISNLKQAEMMAQVQMAVASKVMNVSKQQGQMVAQLLDSTMTGVEQSLGEAAQSLDGGSIDVYA